MEEIYRLDSDAEITEELSEWLKNRVIDQKFIYQGVGADLYYKYISNNKLYIQSELTYNCFLEFYNKNLHSSKHTDLISLGCGKSDIEKYLFTHLNNIYNINYIWVDSSKKMLDLSSDNLSEIKNVNKQFICADFSSKIFRTELSNISSKNRLFVFFSNTFWNIPHTNIIDMLGNLLNKWEQIWLDVRVRKWNTVKDDFWILELIHENLKTKDRKESIYSVADSLWIPRENIEIRTNSKKESFIDALKINFSYYFTKRTEINLKWEKIFILPGESIKILTIYHVSPDGLINFFHEHWFKFIDKEIKGYRGQFLFEKK